jgi:acetoin utilization protein AcuB
MISDRDLRGLRKVYEAPGEESILDSPVSDYMHAEVISLRPESTVVSAIDLLVHLRIGAVPVLDENGELVGILSYVDVLEAARKYFHDQEN